MENNKKNGKNNNIKKKSFIIIIVIVALLACIALWMAISMIGKRGQVGAASSMVETSADTQYWVDIDKENMVACSEGEERNLQPKESVEFLLTVPEDGNYLLALEYQTVGSMIMQSEVLVELEGTEIKNEVYGVWADESKDYQKDRYNNEVTPSQKKLDVFTWDYVRDSSSLDMNPVVYELKAGEHIVKIENQDQELILKHVALVKPEASVSYEEYAADFNGETASDTIVIEGEDYAAKSDSYIRSKSDVNVSCTPNSPYDKLLNSVDYYSWKTVGQRILWNFEVKEEGWYYLNVHYTQSEKEGQPVYRDLQIDGKTLFAEMQEIPFEYTGSGYENAVLTCSEEPAAIYLKEGMHTVSFFTNAPALASALKEVRAIADELSDVGLDLQKVAGSSADSNRTWDIETYVPGITERLTGLQERLLTLYDEMSSAAGTKASSCVNLKLAASIIEQALERPEKLPTYTEQLSIGSGSATSLLAELSTSMEQQGMSLDKLTFYGADYKLPAGNGNFLYGLQYKTLRFADSLLNREASYGVAESSDDVNVIDVWVNRPIAYVETMQLMADSLFTPETGIEVRFCVMPDEGKLLLANATSTCPDVALGISGDRPYQLGLRGAAMDLTQFDDFDDYIESNYKASDLEPFTYDGGIYGMAETKQFYVMMYRKDIMNKLGLEVPDTWNDVIDIMPTLRRSGMTFFLPLSESTGTKPLATIAPFFLQTGTSLYSEDGMSTELNQESGIKAFTLATDLYTLYGVQNNMPSFYNNFRYGVTPCGVASFNNYVQMLYAAPEIADKWGIAPAPGIADENGTVHRQQVSIDKSCLIMSSTKKAEQSWTFLKWWLSTDVQVQFAYDLQTKYGSEYAWNSANEAAFSQLSFPVDDRSVVEEQWAESDNYKTLPATYMLERSLSDAWYAVVEQHESPRIALNEAVFNINQETRVRMQQFGYMDDKGNVLKEYDMRSAQEILDEMD